jgi:phosphatidylinositol alpha-mannosyltransferase
VNRRADSPNSLRVAIYHHNLPQPGRKPGGVEVAVHRLANALSRRGHEIEVLSYSPAPADAAYRLRRLPPRRAESNRILHQYVAPWGLNFQDLSGFDVAHTHGDDWFWLRRSLPVVRTFHGSAKFEARTATSLKRRLDKSVVYPLELLAARLATASYGVGTDSVAIYNAAGLLTPGVDVDVPEAQPSEHPTILFVGSWGGRKRGALLHRIFCEQVRPALPSAELWMVADACEPAPGVRWFDAPSDAELGALYSRAWVYCMPSSYEGFGMPYVEAMAHGVPVLATPNPGSRMLLEHGAGVLAGDEELGARLVELLSDGERRAALRERGLERAGEFSWERVAEHHERAYRAAIEDFRSAAR